MDMKKRKLSDIGEFGFIEKIKDDCHFNLNGLVKGIGDDCAVIGPYDDSYLILTTDLLIEDIHFIMDQINPVDLGKKSMYVNLSDIAAMGGSPLHSLVSIAVPQSAPLEILQGIYQGMKETCRNYGFNILGGDTSASRDRLMINVALIGEVPQKEILYRNRAEKGDKIYVSGPLGDSAAGLKMLKGEMKPSGGNQGYFIKAHQLPQPEITFGRGIARSGLANAMIDISDGLVADLGHICQTSGLGARIYQESIPLSEELKKLSTEVNFDAYELALYGGEDYKLLFTVPAEKASLLEEQFKDGQNGHLYPLGEIITGNEIRMVLEEGREKVLTIKGYNHFL
jgi:thiamine-monophosphate kinase